MAETTSHIYEIFIRTTPEKLWDALTDGEKTSLYYFGTSARNITSVGETYQYVMPDGNAMIDGKVLESDPPRKLVTTFNPHWGEVATESTVTFEIAPEGDLCRLTLRHEGLVVGESVSEGVKDGWARIFSSLKSYLESGEPLQFAEM